MPLPVDIKRKSVSVFSTISRRFKAKASTPVAPRNRSSTINKLHVGNQVAQLTSGVGEIVPIAGSVLKGVSAAVSVLLEMVEAHYQNNEDLQEIGRRVRDTQQLVIDINELATRSSLPNALNQRYLEACQKFEELLRNMEQKINEACRTNAKGLSAYLRTKDIESLIDGLKSELNDIKLDWMIKALAIVHVSSMSNHFGDQEDLYYQLKPADIRLEPETSSIPGFSVASIISPTCHLRKVLIRRFDPEFRSQGGSAQKTSDSDGLIVSDSFEYDLAAYMKLKNLRFLQLFGVCKTSILKAMIFSETADDIMTKDHYQERSKLRGIDWIVHQLDLHLQHSDAAIEMVERHGVVIEAYRSRGHDLLVRPNGQLVITGFRGMHGKARRSWLHDPVLRGLRQSIDSVSLVPIQWYAFTSAGIHRPRILAELDALPSTTPSCACVFGESLLGLACTPKHNSSSSQRWLPGFDFQFSHVVQRSHPNIQNVYEWAFDPNFTTHTLALYLDLTVLNLPHINVFNVVNCAYGPHFNVEWREPRGISITITRSDKTALNKILLYAPPPLLDSANGCIVWQPVKIFQEDGLTLPNLNLADHGLDIHFIVIYDRRYWDPRGMEALIELHRMYEVDPRVRGRDFARQIGPPVSIIPYAESGTSGKITWGEFLRSKNTAAYDHDGAVSDEEFFQCLENMSERSGLTKETASD